MFKCWERPLKSPLKTPGYEEATRALYTGNPDRFDAFIAPWPKDIKNYTLRLSKEALRR